MLPSKCCNEALGFSLSAIVPSLRSLGYHAKLTDQGVMTGISYNDEKESRSFAVLITEGENGFQFNCQIGTIGELQGSHSEESLTALAWVLLSLNSEIQPWSVALINPDGQLDPSDTLVLIENLETVNKDSLAFAMSSLERALATVVPAYI